MSYSNDFDDEIRIQEIKKEVYEDVRSAIQSIDTNDDWTAITPLEHSAEKYNLNEDPQVRKFYDFVAVAANFASTDYASRIQKIPELVGTIKSLIEELQNEIGRFAEYAGDLQHLTNIVYTTITEAKHKAGIVVPHLQATKRNIVVLDDVLNSNSNITEEDKKDVKHALSKIRNGAKNLREMAEKQKDNIKKTDSKITSMKNKLIKHKIMSKGRLELANKMFMDVVSSGILGATIGFVGADSMTVFIPAAVSATSQLPAMAIILCTCVAGGVLAIYLIRFVKKLFIKHQNTAIDYLTRILEELHKLSELNSKLMGYMNYSIEATISLDYNIDEIQECLVSDRRRRLNKNVCNLSIKDVDKMIYSFENVRNIKLDAGPNLIK